MTTLQRERNPWLSILLWLSLVGLVGSLVWAFLSYGGLQDRLAGMSRVVVPGQVEVTVDEPETLTIFYEDPTADRMFVVRSSDHNTLDVSPVDLAVTGPSGERVATVPYERDLRFDYDGRLLIALETIDASTPGTYVVQVSGDVPATAQISVGHVIDVGLVVNVVAVIGLFLVSILGLGVAVVVFFVRRGNRSADDNIERPLVGV
jgi:hypothetical protein